MAILVDQPLWSFRGEKWSHLVSDTNYAELHAMANRVGIRRIGFQGDHYDLPARLLPAALAAGATQVDSRVLVRRLRDAGLRKSASYESWTPVRRRDRIDPSQAQDVVAGALDAIEGCVPALLTTAQALLQEVAENDAVVHQLDVLQRPTQVAVAFDTDQSMSSCLDPHETTRLGAEPDNLDVEVWITSGNPLLAVDLLAPLPEATPLD